MNKQTRKKVMKKYSIIIAILIAVLFFIVLPVQAIDYSKSSPTLKTVSVNTVISPAKYTEWKSAKSQVLQIAPTYSYDAKWQANLPKLKANLDKIDTILTKVKNSSDAYMIANKSYFNSLASELLVLEKYINLVRDESETIRNKRQKARTAFEDFDQKANQLYNLLSSVMKAMNELRMGIIRNIN
jgi:methyl-accepting chemotaxis protein